MATSLGISDTVSGTVVLVDRSCGDCDSCRAGATLWCTTPSQGRPATGPVPAAAGPRLRDAVLSAAAVLEAPASSTVLVVGAEWSPAVLLARSVVDGVVLAGDDLADDTLRARVAAREASGRAPVIVAGGDVRAAVRAVRRGGHVCVPPSGSHAVLDHPSVTELVQREVTLVAPRQATHVLQRLSDADWDAVVAVATTAA